MNIDFDKIEKQFTPKPYHVRNSDFFVLAKSLKWLFQIICVAAGFIFIYQNAFDLTENKMLSITIATVFLVAIEGTKQVLIMRSYEHYITYKRVGIVQVLFALLIIVVSFAISKNGVERYYIDNNKTPSVVNIDSVLQPYRLDLISAQSDKEKAYTLTWEGSKELTGAGQKQLSSAIDKINRIERVIDSVRKSQLLDNEKRSTFERSNIEQKAKRLSWFVVIVDLFLIICLLYPLYFLRKSLTDIKQTKQEETAKKAEKVQKIAIKEAKEPPLPRTERGESSGLAQFVEDLPKMSNSTKVVKNRSNLTKTDLTKFDLSGLTVDQLKVKKNKCRRSISAMKKKSNFEKSKAVQKNIALIEEIDRILEGGV